MQVNHTILYNKDFIFCLFRAMHVDENTHRFYFIGQTTENNFAS